MGGSATGFGGFPKKGEDIATRLEHGAGLREVGTKSFLIREPCGHPRQGLFSHKVHSAEAAGPCSSIFSDHAIRAPMPSKGGSSGVMLEVRRRFQITERVISALASRLLPGALFALLFVMCLV